MLANPLSCILWISKGQHRTCTGAMFILYRRDGDTTSTTLLIATDGGGEDTRRGDTVRTGDRRDALNSAYAAAVAAACDGRITD